MARTREGNIKKVKQGHTYSINTKKHCGHKGGVAKKKHNGEIEVIIYTHSSVTRGKKNIKLRENPQRGDKRDAYILPAIQTVKVEKAGKYHPEVVIRNPVDKSVRRNLQRKKKKGKHQ